MVLLFKETRGGIFARIKVIKCFEVQESALQDKRAASAESPGKGLLFKVFDQGIGNQVFKVRLILHEGPVLIGKGLEITIRSGYHAHAKMQGLKFSHKVLRAVKKDVEREEWGIEHTVNRAGIFEERRIGGFAEAELLGTAGAEVTFFTERFIT